MLRNLNPYSYWVATVSMFGIYGISGMYRLCVYLFVIYGVSATKWSPKKEFRFIKSLGILLRRSLDDDCRMCYGEQDCISLDQARCKYYMETSQLVHDAKLEPPEDSNRRLREAVDSLLFDLLSKVSADPQYKQCIPFVSLYTNCNKENTCTGCKSCSCDAAGSWNCSTVQRCRPEAKSNVDHRALLMVIENLKKNNSNSTRVKRSNADPSEKTSTRKPMSFAALSKWIYGVSPLNVDKINSVKSTIIEAVTDGVNETANVIQEIPFQMANINSDNVTTSDINPQNNESEPFMISFNEISEWLDEIHSPGAFQKIIDTETSERNEDETTIGTTQYQTRPSTITDSILTTTNVVLPTMNSEPGMIAFDEVLSSIAADNKSYSVRKSLDKQHNEKLPNQSYQNFAEVNGISNIDDVYDQFTLMLNTVENGDKVTKSSDKNFTIVAVTESVMKCVTEVFIDLLASAKINDGFNSVVGADYFNFDDNDDNRLNEELDARTRDYDNIDYNNAVNVMKRDVSITMENSTVTTTVAITDKNLNLIHENLKYSVLLPLENILKNKQKEIEELLHIRKNLINFMKTYRSYDLDLNSTKVERDLNAYLSIYKLEIVPHFHYDLRTSNSSILDKHKMKLKRDIFEVISDVIRVHKYSDPNQPMSEYLKNLIRAMKHYIHKQGFHIKKSNDIYKKKNLRRLLESYQTNSNSDFIRDFLVNVIDLIDKNLPESNALHPLPLGSRKIMNRLIKEYNVDKFSATALRVYDPNYNLIDKLQNVGNNWKKMTDDVSNSYPSNRLYCMKLLHLTLSIDINKMHEALALIDFARNRRMMPLEQNIGENIFNQLNIDLQDINHRVLKFIEQDNIRNVQTLNKQTQTPQNLRKKKYSFMNQIKNLLKKSKKEIKKLLHRKVSKSDIIKELAKKKLDELTKRRLYDYEITMMKWQNNLNFTSLRRKRSPIIAFDKLKTSIKNVLTMIRQNNPNITSQRHKRSVIEKRRIKNILPMYLRGKVATVTTKDFKKTKSRKTYRSAHNKKIIAKKTITISPKIMIFQKPKF